jgi:hypothetical protein
LWQKTLDRPIHLNGPIHLKTVQNNIIIMVARSKKKKQGNILSSNPPGPHYFPRRKEQEQGKKWDVRRLAQKGKSF